MLAFPESSCSPARAHLLRKPTFRPKDEECPQKLNTKGEVSGAGALKVFLYHISVPSHAIHATPGRQATRLEGLDAKIEVFKPPETER